MEFTASAIAAMIGGKVDGDKNASVSTFSKIEEGQKGALSFLANPKYTHYIYDTDASVVLVSDDFVPEKPLKCTLIRVSNPYEALSELMTIAASYANILPTGIEQPSFISEKATLGNDIYVGAFAYIGKGAKIGNGVKIYPQVYIGNDCIIEDDTILYPGVKIYHGCKIGKRCIVHGGAVIGADGFGFAPKADGTYHKIPQLGIVCIEDDVEIGANTTIDRATMGKTTIGHGTKLDNLIQIAHNVEIGNNTVMAAQAGVAGSAKIGDNCMIGGQVGVAGHISVGNRVVVGAQSGIPNNVKDGSRLMGYPAVSAGDFMRQAAYMRRLGKLFEDVEILKK